MARDQVGLRQRHVATDHVERGVAEDLLEAEHVAAVDEVAARERVAKRVRRAPRADAGPPAEAGDRLLGTALAQRALPAREERVRHGGPRSCAEIADERPPRGRTQRDDPFLRALAKNVERPVRADVADPEGHDLGQSESGIEEKQDKRPLALVRQSQQAADLRVAEGRDEPARECGRRRARKPGAAASSSATHQLPKAFRPRT